MRVPLRALMALSISIGVFSTTSWSQDYPSKPVKLVVPFSAGGTTDASARLLGSALDKLWKQPVIVENRPGGSQLVGAEYVKGQAPDGYTLFMFAHSLVFEDLMNKTSFNLLNDMVPMAMVSGSGYVLTVPGTSVARNLKDFVANAKSRPGKLNEGTVGASGVAEIRKLWLDLGLDIPKVPYKGGSPTITAIAAGEVDIYGASPMDVVQMVKGGKILPIAYTEQQRHPLFPDLPTVAESGIGFPGFEARYYFAIAGARGVSPAVVAKVNSGVAAALDLAEVREKFDTLGLRIYKESPENLVANLQKLRVNAQAMIAAKILTPNF